MVFLLQQRSIGLISGESGRYSITVCCIPETNVGNKSMRGEGLKRK